MELLNQLEQYRPFNEQEARDREELLRRVHSGEDLYTRDNPAAHFTASAWVVSPHRDQVLLAYHNLYDSWAWLGGHADGERDLLSVAMREVRALGPPENLSQTQRQAFRLVIRPNRPPRRFPGFRPVTPSAAAGPPGSPEPLPPLPGAATPSQRKPAAAH